MNSHGDVGVSVVLVTRDRPELAADAVLSVLAGDLRPNEIIIVDQSSGDDGLLDRLASEHSVVQRMSGGVAGLSSGRNLGASHARGTILAFIDDDELAHPGWLAALVREVQGSQDVLATGRVVPGDPEVPGAIVPATVLDPTPARYRGRLPRDVLAGGNLAVYRSSLLELGGFDTRLGAGTWWAAAEDNDLGLRALDAGYTIAYLPDAVVIHRAWRSGRSYPGIRWRYGLGKGGFYAKHLLDGEAYGLRRATRDVGRRVVKAPLAVWRRPRFAAGELAYAAGVCVGMLGWTLARRPR